MPSAFRPRTDYHLRSSELFPVENMKRDDVVSLFLPSLSEKDPLFAKKQKILHSRRIDLEFHIPFSGFSPPEETHQILGKMVQATRFMHLNETELYFVGDDDFGPFSPRNELESLNSVMSVINFSLQSATNDTKKILQMLLEATVDLIKSFGGKNTEEIIVEKGSSDAENTLLKWGEENGVKMKLQIARIEGAGRGAVAVEDINIGDTALAIPESILITEEHLNESDMFQILKDMDGMTSETMLLLWSMKERYNPNSKVKVYFDSLPKAFNTGLSFGIDALSALEGTLLLEEILQAREHLHNQYVTLCPALCSTYPDIFRPELYGWDQFLWACELWYSNSMKVVSTNGKLKTCLVPIAGLLNHSLCPHILHYGRVDSETKSLKFCMSRPCKEGEQCYLSYGNYSGSHLVTFYGFLPKGDNPYDIIPLDIDTPQVEDASEQLPALETDWTTHMVRDSWLTNTSGFYTYGLPPPLLAHLRVALQEDDISLPLQRHDSVKVNDNINKETERAVLETILSIFNPMMEGLGESDSCDRENSSWDVKLALDFKDLQRRILSSILASCSSGLQMLDRL